MKLSKNKMDRNNKFLTSIIYIIRKNKTYFYIFNNNTPVYNFINDRLVDESAVLRPLSWHLI
ncbi:hypothetical protein, partial [Blautia obeum]|uniref:hypothetical protein n=1 Tax=Blautia obeum TaxID=40520 RepID=UPI001A9A3D6E